MFDHSGSEPPIGGLGVRRSEPPFVGLGVRRSEPPVAGFGVRRSEPPFEGLGVRRSEPPFEGLGVRRPEPPFVGLGARWSEPPVKGLGVRRSEFSFEGLGVRLSEPPFGGLGVRRSEPPFEGLGVRRAEPPFVGLGARWSEPPVEGLGVRRSEFSFEGLGVRLSEPPFEGLGVRRSEPLVEGLGVHRSEPPVEGLGVHRPVPSVEGPGVRLFEPPFEGFGVRRCEPPFVGLGVRRSEPPFAGLGVRSEPGFAPPLGAARPSGGRRGLEASGSANGSWGSSADSMASSCLPVIRMLRSGRRRRPSTDDGGAVGGTNDTHGSEGSPRTAPGPGAGYVQDGQYHSASPVPAGTQTEPRSRSSYSSLQLLPPRATMAPAYQSAPQVPVRPQAQQLVPEVGYETDLGGHPDPRGQSGQSQYQDCTEIYQWEDEMRSRSDRWDAVAGDPRLTFFSRENQFQHSNDSIHDRESGHRVTQRISGAGTEIKGGSSRSSEHSQPSHPGGQGPPGYYQKYTEPPQVVRLRQEGLPDRQLQLGTSETRPTMGGRHDREWRGIWQLSPRAHYEAPPYVLPAVPEALHPVSDRVSDWVEGSMRAHAASSDGDARTHSTFRVHDTGRRCDEPQRPDRRVLTLAKEFIEQPYPARAEPRHQPRGDWAGPLGPMTHTRSLEPVVRTQTRQEQNSYDRPDDLSGIQTRWSTNQVVRNLVDLWYPHLRSHNTNTRLYNRCTINIWGLGH